MTPRRGAARAILKGIVGHKHNVYFGCEKCQTEGDYHYTSHQVCFNQRDCSLRTNLSSRERHEEDHHKFPSIIEELSIDIISTFQLDYLHLVLLVVQKRLLNYWTDNWKCNIYDKIFQIRH